MRPSAAEEHQAIVSEISHEEWSWSLRAWTEEIPRRATRVKFLAPVHPLGTGAQILIAGEPWRHVRDHRVDAGITSAVLA